MYVYYEIKRLKKETVTVDNIKNYTSETFSALESLFLKSSPFTHATVIYDVPSYINRQGKSVFKP